MEFNHLHTEPPGGEDDESPHVKPSNQQITAPQDNNTKPDMECGSEDVGLDKDAYEEFWWSRQEKLTHQEDNNTEPDMEPGSEDVDDNSSCATDLDGLVFKDTDDEQEVGQMEESSDTTSHTYVRRKSNWWSENEWSEDECSTDLDDLSFDDPFPKETENEHQVPADDQEATTSLEGYDIQCSKSLEEKKKGFPSEDKSLVDFAAPSQNLVNSPVLAMNPTDPLCERSAAYVHQAGPQKQNGVQNTVLNVVNVTTDEHFSSTSDVSFQTAPKYQLKEEKQEENIPQIGQETHRLAILRLDLSPVRAADLFARMCYFLPKGGRIMSVAVYTTEKHGPAGLFDDDIDDVQILASVESCQRYYGVVECDSTDTAKFIYNDFIKIFSYIGVTRKMLELRFIPDSMEFSDHLRDIATEKPTTYGGPDLVHLLSAKDLEQLVNVTQQRNPGRLSFDEMARKLSRGTTIVGVQLKNKVGTYLAAYGNNALIHRLGEPVYMLAACAGHILWKYPILSHVEDMAKSKKWTPENCAVYTNMFLNSNYEPDRSIWDLPSKFNVKKTSCEMLFASSMTKRTVEDEEYESQLWSGDCRTTLKYGDKFHERQSNLVACHGSRAKYVKSLLEVGGEIASGNMSSEEVLIKLLEAFKTTYEKYEETDGNIQVYFISRGFDIKLHDGHVDKVEEDVKALKEIIERKKAKP